jgi:O-antigen ligase
MLPGRAANWRNWLLAGLIASGSLDIGLGLLSPLNEKGRVVGFGNSNVTGGHLALLAPLAILAWQKWPKTRLLLIMWLGGAGVVFVGTQSRGGALALLTAAVVLLLAGRASPILGGAAAAMAGSIAVLQLWVKRVGAGSSVQRLWEWVLAWRCFQSAPIFGVGLGRFEAICRASHPVFDPKWCIHPHNTYFRILAETGIIGAAAVLILALAFAWLMLRRWRAAGKEIRQELAIYIASLVGVAAHAVVDDVLYFPHQLLSVIAVMILAMEV